ncbi:hypothetical protein ACH79_26425 [Bradyrhizobium sp. CCBAU 051011]|nr:hypothetical protein ACH79_26425 [Bradyrhizobium sp. CCBAU 051011]
MLQAYLDHGQTDTAVFEFFLRRLRARRGFLVAAGPEPSTSLRIFSLRSIGSGKLSVHGGFGRILDEGDLQNVTIFAAGGLDEDELASMLGANAPVDGFGICTS